VFLISMAVLGLGSGLLDVAPGAVIGDVVEGRGGPVFAAYSMSGDVANVVGPVAAGALAESSYGAAFALTAGILGAATMTGLAMPETRGLAEARAAGSSGAGAGGSGAGAAESGEGGAQVGEQVLDVLDADREPDEIARDLQGGARSAGMGHAPGVLDERFDAAE
jgi:MFS family permease